MGMKKEKERAEGNKIVMYRAELALRKQKHRNLWGILWDRSPWLNTPTADGRDECACFHVSGRRLSLYVFISNQIGCATFFHWLSSMFQFFLMVDGHIIFPVQSVCQVSNTLTILFFMTKNLTGTFSEHSTVSCQSRVRWRKVKLI